MPTHIATKTNLRFSSLGHLTAAVINKPVGTPNKNTLIGPAATLLSTIARAPSITL